MKRRPSPNHDARPEGTPVDMLVLHYTGMRSGAEAIERLCDAQAKVSSHYCIEEDGTVWALVPEERRAWHAGVSYWRGQRDINARSIGIELVNPGHEWGYRPFPEAQMAALIELAQGILARHPIPARNVVGHSDVAPARKQDPGELFDWRRLAGRGIGLWPDPVAPPRGMTGADAIGLLAHIGYDPQAAMPGHEVLPTLVMAFQRHFRQSAVDGGLDEETAGLMWSVSRAVG
ncbi:MAG: N-acetylmuramoyl-L-alanine amidase [Reyranellaceae bacterium]